MQNGRGFQLRSNMDFAGLRSRLRFEHGPAIKYGAETSEAALEDVNKDMEDCTEEIHRLQRRTIFLQNQHRRLEAYRDCLCSLGSIIRKIPNETLLQIFDLACDINEITSKDVKTMPALAISAVCFRWRELARLSPQLWSRLRIEMQERPPNLRDYPVLGFFLSSSQNSSLTLEITGGTDDVRPHQRVLCNTLATHSQRWKALIVSGDHRFQGNVYNALTSQYCRHYPVLEVLLFPHVIISDDLDRFQNAPKLSRVSIGCITSAGLLQSWFPWNQLTHFGYGFYREEMKNILQMCDKLVSLRLEDENWTFQCPPPTMAPNLETLSLELHRSSCTESCLDVALSSLTCPSLTSLIIEAKNEYSRPWPKECFDAFISRSSFHLTTLSMKFVPLSDANLIDLLHSLSSLLHFTIDDSKLPRSSTSTSHNPSPITRKLIESLYAFPCSTTVAGLSTLVRRLQTLEVTYAGLDFDDEGFVDMVSSRWLDDSGGYGPSSAVNSLGSDLGTACLRSVVLRFKSRRLDPTKYKLMDHFEKAGMRVVLIGQNNFDGPICC